MSIPTIAEYTAGIKTFRKESKDWYGMDERHFYTVSKEFGYEESCDNANGGICVRWAFGLSHAPSRDDVLRHYMYELSVQLDSGGFCDECDNIASVVREALLHACDE